MTATPRTDAQLLEWHRIQGFVAGPKGMVVAAFFARCLEVDLARVTAERDELAAKLANLAKERSDVTDEYLALRSRNAELKESLHLADGTANLALHHRDIAEKRNTDLVAALRELFNTTCAIRFDAMARTTARFVAETSSWKINTVAMVMAEKLLNARAGYGTPAKEEPTYIVPHSRTVHTHPDTVRLDQRAIQLMAYNYLNGEWEPTIFEDVDLRAAIDAGMALVQGHAARVTYVIADEMLAERAKEQTK